MLKLIPVRFATAIVAGFLLAGCVTPPPSPPPKIETQKVDVAVPVRCSVTVPKPAEPVARSKDDLWKMLQAAPNVTERARIVSDQLLIWLGYGPKLEAALQGCTDKVATPKIEESK